MIRPRFVSSLPWPSLLLFILTAAVLMLPYCRGLLPAGADLSLMYAPFFNVQAEGGIPLWYPHILSGNPLYNNLQAALLYPPRLPFYWVGDWRDYFGLYHGLHYAAALWGMAVFVKSFGFSRAAVFLGACLYAAGGHLIGRIINPTIFYGACWLPLLFYGARHQNGLNKIAALAAWTLIFTSGSPHIMLYGFLGYLLTALLAGAAGHTTLKDRLWEGAERVYLFTTALALAFPTLLPGIIRSQSSIRNLTTTADNFADSVTFAEIPFLFLGGTGGGLHPEYIDKACYMGAPALLLLLTAFFRKKHYGGPALRLGFAFFLAGLLLALGKHVGLDKVWPHLPGVQNLAGPSRALVLTAVGAGLLAAQGLEGLPGKRPSRLALFLLPAVAGWGFLLLVWYGLALSEDHSLMDLLRFWWEGPSILPPLLFLAFDGAVGLTLAAFAGGILCEKWGLKPVLALLVLLQCLHFAPRVQPPFLEKAAFDSTPALQFLQTKHQKEPPFRVMGYDPLRFHHTDFNETHLRDFLAPNLAALYGLEEIQGFDPLIKMEYMERMKNGGGRAPFDDPIRTLNLVYPVPDFLAEMNVGYLVGHPRDRRLTSLPVQLSAGKSQVELKAPLSSNPVTHWLCVSLLDGRPFPARGQEVARLKVQAREGNFSFPIRAGIETAHFQGLLLGKRERPPLHSRWSMPVPAPERDYKVFLANYRGIIKLPLPLHVEEWSLQLMDNRYVLYVASQAVRQTLSPDSPWKLVFGETDDVAPVYALSTMSPRAQWLGERGAVDWQSRSNGRFVVEKSGPGAGTLLLRYRYHPGWEIRVDGRQKIFHKTREGWIAVKIPAGLHRVEGRFHPADFFVGLWVAAAALVLFGVYGLRAYLRRRKRVKAGAAHPLG